MQQTSPGSTFFRRYLALALPSLLVVLTAVGIAGQEIIRRSIIAEAKSDAEHLARGICEFELGELLAEASVSGRLAVSPAQEKHLTARLGRYVEDFDLVEIRLHDRNGSLVFSTEAVPASRVSSRLGDISAVLTGTTVALMRPHGETPLMNDRGLTDARIVESAIPLLAADETVIGVMTIYSGVERFMARGRRAHRSLLVALALALALTLLAETLLVRRTCRRMDANARDLVNVSDRAARSRDDLQRMNEKLVAAEAEAQVQARRARAADEAKTAFLANMSHEMRTPLTAILGYADLIADPVTAAAVREDHLGSLRRNGMHLLALIEDILDLAQIERGEMAADLGECSVAALVDETADRARRVAEAKRLSLVVNYRTGVPATIRTDAPRLRQALMKLLDNAVKFTHRGEITLEIAYQERSASGKPALVFHVLDSGIGLPEEIRVNPGHVFEQGDGEASREFGGTGMGLHIAASIAVMLGGHLCAYARDEGGAHLQLTVATGTEKDVPLVRPGTVQPQPATGAQLIRLDGVKVLYAEDGPDNQFLVKAILKRSGATADIAPNGALALEMAAAGEYDLVLMDIQMPVMDGLEATRRLRADGFERPILALTANAMDTDRARSAEAGCDLHLTKPINRRALLEAIRDQLAVPA